MDDPTPQSATEPRPPDGGGAPEETGRPEDRLVRFFRRLARRVEGDLRTEKMDRILYATDASLYQIEPVAVLLPRTEEDVGAAVEEAARAEVPVLPRGGGSSLAGQAVGEALVIDFSRHLDEILEIRPRERLARVQPGVVLDHLNEALAEHGLMVGPDPASSNRATLGGMVANNATGTHSILYGNMVDHLRAARVVLDDGSRARLEALEEAAWREKSQATGREGAIYRQVDELLAEREAAVREGTPRHWRRAGGYRLERLLDRDARNMADLLAGSEGTLAVATELTVDLVERPARTGLGVVHFRSRSEALRAVGPILETEPSAVELFDEIGLRRCREVPEYARRLTFTEGEPEALLITEYYGASQAEIVDRVEALRRRTVRSGGAYAVRPVLSNEEIENVWEVRKAGLGLVMGVKGDHKPVAFIEDAAVPVEHLPEYVEELERLFEETRTEAVVYAHASGGCLHVRPFVNTKDRREVEKMREIAHASMELVRRYGGDISSEHGNGLARSWLNEELFGPELYETYRDLKRIFDPKGILNPGKKVDAPEMSEHLRMGPDYETEEVETRLDFSADGGFARSVELCNGAGVCRKLGAGTMCPSFMVTREEEDSTRGRANALRAALSGAIDPEELTGGRMKEVMDLCISCKACKSECPSAVDMAKIKAEWLGRYRDRHGVPGRARLFAYLPEVSRLVSGPAARLANWVNRRAWIRGLVERLLGVSADRALPEFAPTSFTAWYGSRHRPVHGRRVVLFQDTFNDHHRPETARAAYEVLTGLGYSVVLANHGSCGRTYLSEGLIDTARRRARNVVDSLEPYVDEGLPVVGLEPSCILTLRDEYADLLAGDGRVDALAEQTWTFSEFLADRIEEDRLEEVDWSREERELLVHGHCHQKALVGTGPTERCLSLPPGHRVRVVDSGCCGMAGAFGYEAEHVEISRRMAERRLAPAVREAGPETTIVAAGISCRAQIVDTTGRTALHPAEVIRDAMR